MELRQYLAVIAKHRWMILSLLLSAVAASLVASFLLTPIYQATTTILIKDEKSLANPFLEALGGMGKTQVADFVEVLKSKTLQYAVARRHNLVPSIDSPEMEALRRAITIQPVVGTNVIRISVESPMPEVARDVANDLVQEFIAQNQREDTTAARGARAFVGEQIRIVSRELAEAEEALRRYKKENKVFAPAEEVKAVLDRVAKLEVMRAETAVALNEAGTRLAQINRQLGREQQRVVSATTIAANPLVQQLKGQLSSLEVELSGAREKYTDKHPAVVALRSQVEEVKGQMRQAAERIVASETETANPVYQELLLKATQLEVERLALDVRRETLERLVAEEEKLFTQLPDKELQLVSLTRNAKVSEQTYLMLKQKYEELRITEAMKSGNVRIVDEAVTPAEPVRPRKALNVAIAAFLSLFTGVGLAFLLEYLDTTIRTPEELEEVLGLPVLGQIPSYQPVHLKQMTRGGRA
ncbi:MAG: GNVR domain-containing protein [Bacillota bacterium]|nr:GNVR domain-containing protein [Bacillota bacterium]